WSLSEGSGRSQADPVICAVAFGPWLCKNSTRYNRTRNFELYGHAESKKTQEFAFRSALRPNQISFSHSQDPKQTSTRPKLQHAMVLRLAAEPIRQDDPPTEYG